MVSKALRGKQAGFLQALARSAHAQNDASFRSTANDQSPPEPFESLRRFGFTFPNHNHTPAQFLQCSLMQFVARGVAIQFREPPFVAVRRRRAVPASFVSMPEADRKSVV